MLYWEIMERVVYRRTLNIGDYETLNFETIGEHENLNTARLIAVQRFLELAQQELIRIYNVKASTNGSAWDRVNQELSGIQNELNGL
ncbi:hypothetical protein LCGC14_3094130 [marine sediment metagenome]|uniref:Uncharacterized protein n=1 Tax=marine sediment metagenome TaxID=412755 RepID=A0A0F8YH56_9ZZZZ